MASLDGVKVGDMVVPEMKADGAIMDTGTSLITTSMQDAAAINSVSPRCNCVATPLGNAHHVECLRKGASLRLFSESQPEEESGTVSVISVC